MYRFWEHIGGLLGRNGGTVVVKEKQTQMVPRVQPEEKLKTDSQHHDGNRFRVTLNGRSDVFFTRDLDCLNYFKPMLTVEWRERLPSAQDGICEINLNFGTKGLVDSNGNKIERIDFNLVDIKIVIEMMKHDGYLSPKLDLKQLPSVVQAIRFLTDIKTDVALAECVAKYLQITWNRDLLPTRDPMILSKIDINRVISDTITEIAGKRSDYRQNSSRILRTFDQDSSYNHFLGGYGILRKHFMFMEQIHEVNNNEISYMISIRKSKFGPVITGNSTGDYYELLEYFQQIFLSLERALELKYTDDKSYLVSMQMYYLLYDPLFESNDTKFKKILNTMINMSIQCKSQKKCFEINLTQESTSFKILYRYYKDSLQNINAVLSHNLARLSIGEVKKLSTRAAQLAKGLFVLIVASTMTDEDRITYMKLVSAVTFGWLLSVCNDFVTLDDDTDHNDEKDDDGLDTYKTKYDIQLNKYDDVDIVKFQSIYDQIIKCLAHATNYDGTYKSQCFFAPFLLQILETTNLNKIVDNAVRTRNDNSQPSISAATIFFIFNLTIDSIFMYEKINSYGARVMNSTRGRDSTPRKMYHVPQVQVEVKVVIAAVHVVAVVVEVVVEVVVVHMIDLDYIMYLHMKAGKENNEKKKNIEIEIEKENEKGIEK